MQEDGKCPYCLKIQIAPDKLYFGTETDYQVRNFIR